MTQMYKIENPSKFCLFLISVVICFSAVSVSAAGERRQGEETLLDVYHRIEAKLEKNNFSYPFYLESVDQNSRLHVDVYGIVNHPFSSVLNALKLPANWCDIASLHPDVKACIYKEPSGILQMTLYSNRKGNQTQGDTCNFSYRFRNIEQRQGYLDIVLNADEGPFGTKDHKLVLEALPLNEEKTFIHVSYAYSYGILLCVVKKIPFLTPDRNKTGFTVTGTDSSGNPVYVNGPRGAIERNAVRHYFAIQSFMDTFHYPEENRFSMRISKWYDLTDLFRKQLFEMEKADYLSFKTEEHNNQLMLQRRVSMSR